MSASASPPAVSICIPAWNSAPFIERTLDCATAQTHEQLAILVSVDRCEDATAEICRRRALCDARIRVFEQPQRLGWAANVNFLLDQVDTPCFCLYFHDDVLEPRYVEALLAALARRPDAASVHCDMGHFGASEHVSPGCPYEGSAAQRLMRFLLAPERGSPLRSLTRSEHLPRLRFPTDAVAGLWANEPYLMRLLAAGPALRHGEVLYRRWNQRRGGLTDGWKALSAAHELSGFKANLASAVALCESVAGDAGERDALIFSLHAHYLPRLRALEQQRRTRLFDSPAELHPAFADIAALPALARFGDDLAQWALARHQAILAAEARRRAHAGRWY